jgi:hypothetical protein
LYSPQNAYCNSVVEGAGARKKKEYKESKEFKEYEEYEEYKEEEEPGAEWPCFSWILAPCSTSSYSSYSLYSFFTQLFLFYADHRRSYPFLSGRSVS